MTNYYLKVCYSLNGDDMKKVIITVVSALLVGTIFGILYFKNTKESIADALSLDNEAIAFQVGVYRNLENANKEASKYPSGTIIIDGEFYRIFIAISSNEQVTTKLKNYYDSKKIHYYLKSIVIPDDFMSTFSNYQEVLLKTTSYDEINSKMMKEYSESINGVYN